MKQALETLQEVNKAFKEHGNFDLNDIPVDYTLRTTATAIRRLKKLIKKEQDASYLLAYTLRTTGEDKTGRTTTKDVDHYEIFCEPDEMESTPAEQAKQRLDELIQQYDDEDSATELYCWNIARITKTSEHYPT